MEETKENMLKFKTALDRMADTLHRPRLNKSVLRVTWECLKEYEINEVTEAIEVWLVNGKPFMPSPSELVQILNTLVKKDGTGELKIMQELEKIKEKSNNPKLETYRSALCSKCGGSGYIVLEQTKPPYYGMAFACDCIKGVSKTEAHKVYTIGLQNGYDWPNNIKKEKE